MNPITAKLLEWLDATTSYSTELKENVNLKPNHHKPTPEWRSFYYYGPILVESPVMATDAEPAYEVQRKYISYNKSVQPGDIITSGNGKRYVVQPTGALRKI